MGYNLLINGIYGGYNPLTNLLLTSWDIQVTSVCWKCAGGNKNVRPLPLVVWFLWEGPSGDFSPPQKMSVTILRGSILKYIYQPTWVYNIYIYLESENMSNISHPKAKKITKSCSFQTVVVDAGFTPKPVRLLLYLGLSGLEFFPCWNPLPSERVQKRSSRVY